ncbi:uncharacterized protein [Henckelia pumila]|uniref:uncharacterized protein n=1 Tax=Henckelia pumila TaxID=405737 RepID=UPI003C6DCB4B
MDITSVILIAEVKTGEVYSRFSTSEHPIYFFSHALKGAELRYSEVEKLALALVMTARKLRPYFLSDPIVVLTNSPIGRTLTRSDIFGILVKCNTELSEYDIQYETRSTIKAQALADFLAKTKHMEGEDLWKIYVDGSSINEGSKQVGTARVHLYYDSQLVAQQVNESYEVKSEKLKEYMKVIEEDRALFDEVAEAHYVLMEIHEGCCGNHLGSYSLARKVLIAGYFWPTILKDAIALVTSCDICQGHRRLQH